MSKKSSTALVFNPFGGILDTNPRRRRNMGGKGAVAIALIAGVAGIVGCKVSQGAITEAQGTTMWSGPSMKAMAITGGVTAVVAGVGAVLIAKMAK